MARDNFHVKLVAPVAATSLLMFALCTLLVVLVFQQQRGLSSALGEDIASRSAAARLEESLANLMRLLPGNLEGARSLHDEIKGNLAEVQRHANKEKERTE